jgi:hypothetical protein
MNIKFQDISLDVDQVYSCFQKYISTDLSKLESCLLRTDDVLYIDVRGLEIQFPTLTFFHLRLTPGSLAFTDKFLVPIQFFNEKYFELGLHNKQSFIKDPMFTYICVDRNNGLYKIGKSKSPKVRERTLQSEKPSIEMLFTIKGEHEKELHAKYHSKRVRGEWFRLTDDELSDIQKLIELKKLTV